MYRSTKDMDKTWMYKCFKNIGIETLFLYLYLDDVNEAYNLIKDLEPTTPQEYILKGVVNAALGQDQGSVRNKNYILMLDNII